MRISDWSSDVCSSDLAGDVVDQGEIAVPAGGVIADKAGDPVAGSLGGSGHPAGLRPPCPGVNSLDICRPVSRCRSVGAGQSLPGRPAGLPTMLRNSWRVRGSSRKAPSMRLVTMVTPGL